MTNDSLKAVEKYFNFYVMDTAYPSNPTILKQYPMFYSEIENNVLQSPKVSAAQSVSVTEIFCWKDPGKFRTIKLLTKNPCVTFVTHKSLES